MRLALSAATAATLLLATVVPAAAQAPAADAPPPMTMVSNWSGLYIGAQGGHLWRSDKLTESTTIVPPQTGHASLGSSSWSGGGHIGYNWQISRWVFGPEFDLEGVSGTKTGQCLIQDAGVGNPTPGACFPGSYFFQTKLEMDSSLRGRLGFLFGDALLYGTGGLAMGEFATSYGQVGGSQTFKHVKQGWTAGGGVEYAFTPNWHGRLEYRYTDYGTFSNPITTGGVFWNNYTDRHKLTDNALRIGISYLFGVPAPAPAPMAAPAPPPAAAKVFIVFFDWDKDTITPEGQAIIQQAADAYKAGAPVQIQVTGYTDRSGSPGYNQRLSERRANNVARALAALGVPKTQMAVSGRGENDNRVPTAPGVREPQNRRVEIVAP